MQKVINIVFTIFILLLIAWGFGSTARANKYRGLCNQYREQCIETERVCDELRNELGRVREITGRLSETANSNVADARSIVETVERLRAEVQELEDCCGRDSQREYYQYWDDIFNIK